MISTGIMDYHLADLAAIVDGAKRAWAESLKGVLPALCDLLPQAEECGYNTTIENISRIARKYTFLRLRAFSPERMFISKAVFRSDQSKPSRSLFSSVWVLHCFVRNTLFGLNRTVWSKEHALAANVVFWLLCLTEMSAITD